MVDMEAPVIHPVSDYCENTMCQALGVPWGNQAEAHPALLGKLSISWQRSKMNSKQISMLH